MRMARVETPARDRRGTAVGSHEKLRVHRLLSALTLGIGFGLRIGMM
jgi:hypothetical protein